MARLLIAALGSIFVSHCVCDAGHAEGERGKPVVPRPNVVVIVADDMGFSDAGCYGGEIQTPNLDRLAGGGLRFTQFYNTARCWPSRAALMTGYYPQQIRMDPPRGRVPEWTRALPQFLRPLGYRSYHAGKWHVMGVPRTCADAGFDHSYRLEDHDHNFNPKNLLEDDLKLPAIQPGSGYYTTTAFADQMIRYLKEHAEQHAKQPFFAYLAFTSPHFPLQAPQEDIDCYRDQYQAGWEVVRAERYKELGGQITLIAKPGVGHHPHGLDDSTPIVEFIYKNSTSKQPE